ncbi:MAG: hypothetical protein FWF96_04960, partial [Kiritimatiellaeota bacterium]|nr:hypothetical protein [Kiritimatiellota bacterium]
MDFSDDQGTPETPPMEKAKPVRRARAGCLPFAILLAAVVAAVAFLPQILSTPPARKIILRKLNEKIAPVKVDASWTLRWRGAQEFHTVRVEDFSRGFVFECPRATATPRWWLLLLSVKHPNLGKIVLEKPVFTLQRGAGLPAGGEDDARGKSGGLPQGGLMAFARRVTVEVEVSQGRVGEAGADDSFVAFNAALRARTFAKPLELTLEAGDGKISLAAATPPPASLRDSRRDFILRTGARLEMDRADARLANAALKLFGFNTWQVGGLATGVVSLEPVEKTAPRARVSANVDVENFLIAPNGESSRTPRRAPLSLKVETELSPNHLDIHAFELSSAWVEARASGAMRKTVFTAAPAGKIEGETKIHWAALQEDFDAVPTLPEGVRVSRGAVAAVFSAEGREDAMVFALRAEGEGLELSNGAKTAAVEPPPLLDVEVARPYTSPPALARLEARLPFLSARARGTADNAELSCGVDFDVLTRGCGALFARAPRLSGALMLNAGMAREGGAAWVSAEANTVGFNAAFASREPLALGNAKMVFTGSVPLSESLAPLPEMRRGKWELSSPALRGRGSFETAGKGPPALPFQARGVELGLDGDLAALAKLVAPWLPQLQRWQAKGAATLNMTAEVADGVARARFVSLLRDASLATRRFDIREPGARFDGALAYDAGAREWALSNVKLAATAGSLEVEKMTARFDAARRVPALDGAFTAELNLATVASWQHRGLATTGRLKVSTHARTPGDGAVEVDAEAALENAVLPLSAPLRMDRGTLRARAALAANAGTLEVRELALRLPFLEADAEGVVTDLLGAAHARLAGTLTPDLEKLDPLWPREWVDAGFHAKGRETRPARFEADLADGLEALRVRGHASGAVFVESLAWRGGKTDAADAVFELDDGVLGISYAPKIGTGAAVLKPSILVASYPPVLALKQEAPLLDKVPLSGALAEALLARANPALKGLSGVSGVLTLGLDAPEIPLDGTWRTASFDGHARVENLRASPGAALEKLSAMEIDPATARLELDVYESVITGREGRFTMAPMTLKVMDAQVPAAPVLEANWEVQV